MTPAQTYAAGLAAWRARMPRPMRDPEQSTRYWLDARDPARTRHRPHSLDGRSVDAMFGTFYRGRPDFAAHRRKLRR